MEIAEILVLGAAVLIFGDLVQLLTSRGRRGRLDLPLAPLACLLLIGAYLILAGAFVTNDFRYEEVYSHSSSGLSFAGRLYASWASSTSSWMFLTALLALGYLVIRFWLRDRELETRAFKFLDVVMLFFILVILVQSPFALFPQAQMDGRGLNPLLQTPWMLIHPPVVFLSYALAFYSFAFTFDAMAKDDPLAISLVRWLAQLSWLMMTIGIALGGVWAYEVLGWGGYWAWDPVETASLIPWITLTAYFHLTTTISGRGTSSRELMVMVTSALIVLETAITRGGLAVSVHAFGQSPIGFVLLALAVMTAGYFVFEQRKTGKPLFDFNLDTESVYSTSLSLSFVSLIMLSLVSLWGLLFPIIGGAFGGGASSVDADFFNKWSYPFVLVFVASLIGCHLHAKLDTKKYVGIVVGLFVLGIVGGFMNFPTPNMLANLGIPLTLFALGAVVYGVLESGLERRSGLLFGRSIIHLGVVFVVLGILLSSTSVADYGEYTATPGSTLDLGGIRLEFGRFTVLEPFGNVHSPETEACCNPEADGLVMPVTMVDGGSRMSGEMEIYLYTLHGIVSKPLILRALDREYYLVLQQNEEVYFSLVHTMVMDTPLAPDSFVVSLRVFPLMNVIWFGVILMCVGIVLPLYKLRRAWKKEKVNFSKVRL